MGLSGIEPLTSRLSGVRSNHLSYRPRSSTRLPFLSGQGRFHLFYELFRSLFVSSEQTTICFVLVFYIHYYSRKEVIQPHLPVRLPCYDLAPVTGFTFGSSLLAVGSLTSGTPGFHGLTGGVYKARERIHRAVLMRDY